MKIVLLGQEFLNNNLGCDALSYSFVNEFETIARKLNIDTEYCAVVFKASDSINVPFLDKKIKCIKVRYKRFSFWKSIIKAFKDASLIVDLTGGDSFSDIYGKKRFFMASLIKMLAIKSKTPFMLGPQTYGPYKRGWVKKMATRIIKRSKYVFARDEISKEFAEELSGRKVILTTDVAFSLPFEREAIDSEGKIKIGFNPSGLLWRGGYENARLDMATDYQQYCRNIIGELSYDPRYAVYLIPHVVPIENELIESDSKVCELLHKEFPNTHVFEGIDSPMKAKGLIASMDLFIGARMHATIAAFSTGVANIPFSYSRKFEGLYGSLNYSYVIHAKEISTQEAIKVTRQYIEDLDKLKEKTLDCQTVIGQKISFLREELEKIIKETHKK